jgi:hypothetical protein
VSVILAFVDLSNCTLKILNQPRYLSGPSRLFWWKKIVSAHQRAVPFLQKVRQTIIFFRIQPHPIPLSYRYKIRGIRNLLFYGPPDHPQFYTELLSFPFLDEGVEATDITCRVLYSKYDWFRLERIAGTEGAADLIRAT